MTVLEKFNNEKMIGRIKALYDAGYSCVEIAKLVGLPESTVRRKCHENDK